MLFKNFWQPSGDGNILVLDIGTTGVKALVFAQDEKVRARAYCPLHKTFPQPGYVEQDPFEYLQAAQAVLRQVVREARLNSRNTIGLGITNQRETVIAWDNKTGQSFYPAIVWEDVRTTDACLAWKREFGEQIRTITGLEADPYFTASKIRWLLDHVAEVRRAANNQTLACGTVDTWLLWNFLVDKPFLTDDTNASRTLLFNTRERIWDESLLNVLKVPRDILPTVRHSHSLFGLLSDSVIGFSLPVLAVVGDQQASMYAAGTSIGATKITYGTGTFLMQIIGTEFEIHDPFFTTIVPGDEKPLYGVEYKVARGGREVEPLIGKTEDLKAMLYELAREIDIYVKKLPIRPTELVIDGGVSRDGYIATIQAEVSGIPTREQQIFDGTALGTARLVKSSVRI